MLYFFKTYIQLGFKIFVLNRFRTNRLLKELKRQCQSKGLALSREQLKRIRFYTMQSCITNSWFGALSGWETSSKEIRRALYVGAVTPVLDDLTDTAGYRFEEMLEKIENIAVGGSTSIFLLKYLYEKTTKDADKTLLDYLGKALEAQDESLQQLQAARLPPEKLQAIAFAKGGYFTLFYRSILRAPLIEGEEEAIYLLGGLLQLANDLFDVYKDSRQGQQTLYTNASDLEALSASYKSLIKKMIAQFLALDYPFKQKKKALTEILIVLSRGVVCMNQLLDCQKKTNNVFDLEKYSREELICDMEKWANIKESIKFCLTCEVIRI